MAHQPKLRDEPPPPSEVTLGRYGARTLSPTKAARLDPQRPSATSYIAHRLILAGDEQEQLGAKNAIEDATPGIVLKRIKSHLFELRDGDDQGHAVDPDHHVGAGYRIVPTGRDVVLPEAWSVLQAARAKHPEAVAGASLDHLMFGPSIGGTAPFTSGFSTGGTAQQANGLALASYGQVGSGGRQVVSWVGADPVRNVAIGEDSRPRVAIFDSGCGEHPWLLQKQGVARFTVGGESDKDDPEKYADQDSPLLGELDSHAGHGTFIAGIIRQYCPDADLMSIRVMNSDGVVKEWETLHALQVLTARMQQWVDGNPDGIRVDVVVLSLGYYHEAAIDQSYTFLLRDVLAHLGSLGVVVVAASGNDATTREFYPAALSPRQDLVYGEDDTGVPVIAVGSLNPDESIALFNNSGSWIRAWEPGVSLVSTVPKMQGSVQPRVRLNDIVPGEPCIRSSIDDDNFASGFALWSGTSFSAPLLAAKIAKKLLDGDPPVQDATAARKRGWAAVEATTNIRLVPPPLA